MASIAIGLGGTAAAATRDPAILGRVTVAALVHLPAMWLTVGFTLALVGRTPRFSIAAWALVAVGTVIAMFGGVLQLPGWALGLSPFEHIPLAPAESLALVPLLVMLAATSALAAIGLDGLRRRDIG
jgi:ABC-2 type transport system permease protein